MMEDLLHRIAITLVPNIGVIQARTLIDHFGDAANVFRAKKSALEKREGIGAERVSAIKKFDGFKRAEEEIIFIGKYKITPLFLTDADYPKRL
jgi:DNA processing protein